jgi:transcriptional regulator with XRE-family HTH domain
MNEIRVIVLEALAWSEGNQAVLAQALGVTRATVSRWALGQTVPDAESCLRLAKLTGRTAAEVFRAAGLDPDLLPGERADALAQTELASHVRRWARALASLPERERAIALRVVTATVNSLTQQLAGTQEAEPSLHDGSPGRS